MSITLLPLSSVAGATGQFTDDNKAIIRPYTSLHESCEIRLKQRHLRSDKGLAAEAEWVFADAVGDPIDLDSVVSSLEVSASASESESSSSSATFDIKARFSECGISSGTPAILETDGDFVNNSTGTVSFALPTEYGDVGGLYRFQVAVIYDDGTTCRPILINTGLWSVEEGMWGDTTKRSGIPSLMELRGHIRDSPVENDLLDDVEFDDDEIIMAITSPIQQWNEIPPPVATHTCRTFPFRYHWRQAIVGELMRTAAHHYLRNELRIDHGGLRGNFKDKASAYLQLAELYKQEWREFAESKKIEINIRGAYNSLGSDYGRSYWE